MPVTTAPTYGVQPVADVSRTETGARITFRDGSAACLDASHPNFSHLLQLVEWAAAHGRAVGTVVGTGGQIVDLNAAHDTGVYWLREFPTDPDRFRVAFWAYSPVCALTREHPEFDRIHGLLTGAAGTQQQVRVVTHSDETVDDEPDEDGTITALPKIMDVRPA
jgi:hypothetical protein